LIGGQTSLLFATMPTVLPQVQAGRLKALAVTGSQRSPAAPQLPTIAEALFGFEVTNWIGVFAPAGTPREVVTRLNGEVLRVMQAPDIQARLTAEGAKSPAKTPDEFGAFVRAEIAKWARVIQQAGIRVD
jgi:tripartite-type tricarboxylate transporter receptor subunit TctC